MRRAERGEDGRPHRAGVGIEAGGTEQENNRTAAAWEEIDTDRKINK